MRSLIIAVAMLFTTVTFAQIRNATNDAKYEVVGSVGGGNSVSLSKYTLPNADNTYTYLLTYRNLEYTSIVDIESVSFNATEEDINYLFKELYSVQKGQEKRLDVGDDRLYVTKSASSIVITVIGKYRKDSWFMITPKRLQKVFNK